ncbi:S-methyl-5-thioribose-1-phosphate isomerase [Clostridium estertheticum]|uniref:Methylthioribose-1-phosphate isomerase n=1 Tax=Clostridium estertheticum TaxID=238834 RepID=A0AA47EMC4_9CLOT|nr:S-methyl-5-thioribose-1-phosphate isomerase [Clostridium estertheticum]MBU3154552.1 S-methyl-5-thioribose-1-phosphate isomerase [Clostridium estertheticum]MBU3201005.1 S-methyl-5-thioribose-1-phosphate isomerase [Clostridium estertheticum]MCB2362322.1 S-methyl-5-thioribose-1-phosphate isomerase [Clostridium estertheticum]WAG62014.1 S-methyl-5-thioribose-1-phosphate isomerase [Clostridium estertheticum]WAG63863.1 S-methyl-5-thioribose-1-phosphate isomerase [Clostridium estertheticum]
MDKYYDLGITFIESVKLDDCNNTLIILDQTLLPNEKIFLEVKKLEDIWEAIHSLRVRGAPAIGITAAFGIYLWTKASSATSFENLFVDFKKGKDYLASARPTAVNLFWALDRMENRLNAEKHKEIAQIKVNLKDEAEKIHFEDAHVCEAIGNNTLSLLQPGWGILTHCNAGTIATARLGTALAPIYIGNARGYDFKVFADETRPLLQGARLTAWELKEASVDVTLICDNMASIVMKQGKIQAVLVGCDRIAANGDVANKIGTSGVAILAKYYNIPFYVCAPLSTIDLKCKNGDEIDIELRSGEEITSKWYSKPMAPEGVKTYNPCFDVTDNKIITAIITEKGIVYPPYEENLSKIF